MSKKIRITESQFDLVLNGLIKEQMELLDEMARETSQIWKVDPEFDQKLSFDRPYFETGKMGRIPIIGKNPETGEYEPGKLYSLDLRVSPTGHKAIRFLNHEKFGQYYKDFVRWAVLNDDMSDIERIYPDTPRNAVFGSSWTGPTVKPNVDDGAGELPGGVVSRDPEDRGKRVLFPIINEVFGSRELFQHMHKCGLPEIFASNKTTEQRTNVQRRMSFNGPNLNLTISTMRHYSDPQAAAEKSLEARMALDAGDDLDVKDMPDYMRREFASAYPGSKWDASQASYGKRQYQGETPIYKLKKRFVQKGESFFNRQSYLTITSVFNENTDVFTIEATFLVKENRRDIDKEVAKFAGNIVSPITKEVMKYIPGVVNTADELLVYKYPKFYKLMIEQVLGKLRDEILQIDPDDTLPVIQPGLDVDFD